MSSSIKLETDQERELWCAIMARGGRAAAEGWDPSAYADRAVRLLRERRYRPGIDDPSLPLPEERDPAREYVRVYRTPVGLVRIISPREIESAQVLREVESALDGEFGFGEWV